MKRKTIVAALSAIGLGLALATPAAADVTFYSPFTVLHDDDLDAVVDNNSNGILDKGDRLVSVIEFHDSEGTIAGQGPTSFEPALELTAVADVTILTVLSNGTLVFGASGSSGVLSGFAAGTTVALFTDTTPDLDVLNSNSCPSATTGRADCLAQAGLGLTDGSTLWATIGFAGDADEFWISTPAAGGTSLTSIHSAQAGTSLGSFTFGQSILINNTGQALDETVPCTPFCGAGNGLVDVVGNGQILGGAGLQNSQWDARSKANAQVEPVPEPGTLALLGMALAGLGATWRKRKSRS